MTATRWRGSDLNPNNCKTCDHIHHKDGGHCYMYREPPAQACLSHTARVKMWRDLASDKSTTRPDLGQLLKEKRMDAQAFTQTYNKSRNGANFLVRHPLAPRFKFSDGVQDLAGVGCFWLLDILATEMVDHFRYRPDDVLILVKVVVKDDEALITASARDDDPAGWRREITFTDMPEGEWSFIVGQDEPGRFTMILPAEY